jgi:hypothetical protein
MTWAVVAWCVLIIVWAISAGASSSESVDDCVAEGVLSRADCQAATDAGTGIGILLILFVGFFGFMFLSVIWFMSRPKEKQVVYVRESAPNEGDRVGQQ